MYDVRSIIYIKDRIPESNIQYLHKILIFAAADARKMVLYLPSILNDFGLTHMNFTILYEYDMITYLMAQIIQHTLRTRYTYIKHFSILDWVEIDIIELQHIKTNLY